MNKNKCYLFVYGTLMRGLSNHKYLKNEKFICQTEILDFELYNVTNEYPGIIKKENSKVQGELYQINRQILEDLDKLEGDEYKRIEVNLITKEDRMKAFTYLWTESVNNKEYISYEKQPWRKK